MRTVLAVPVAFTLLTGCYIDLNEPPVATGLLLQRDGRILVSTVVQHFDGEEVGPVFRLHPDGRLDTAFDGRHLAGRKSKNRTTRVLGMLEDRAGRILMAIAQNPSLESGWRFRIVRLQADGSPDESFGRQMDVILADFPTSTMWARLGLLPGSGYLVALYAYSGQLARDNAFLLWIDTDGTLLHQAPLSSLATDGVLPLEEPAFLVARADTSFVVAGSAKRHRRNQASLFAFHTDRTGTCTVDLAVGPQDARRRDHRGPLLRQITGLLPEPDGSLIVASDGFLLRLLSDGTADPDFHFDTASLQSATPRGIVRQSNGRIIVGTHAAAYRDSTGTLPGLVIVRPNGGIDTTGMRMVGRGPRPLGQRLHLVVQPDNAILVAGTFDHCGDVAARALTRLDATGAPDSTFLGSLALDW